MNFEEKVKAMSGAEIVRAMTAGLRKRWVEIDMDSFGYVSEGICFGCAATNTVCQIVGKKMAPEHAVSYVCGNYIGIKGAAKFAKADINFIERFEPAIDVLRNGSVSFYNNIAEKIGVAQLKKPSFQLPYLGNDFTEADLLEYDRYADELEAG